MSEVAKTWSARRLLRGVRAASRSDSSPESDESQASITAFGRRQLPLRDAGALGDEGRVHSGLQRVEVLIELLAGVAGLEPRPAQLRGSVDSWLSAARMAITVLVESVRRCQIRQPGIDRGQNPVLSQEE